jgi:HPt (histidine-containing phosphotransfer) domain-containing protein
MSATNEPKFDWSQAASLLGDDPTQVADDMAEIVRELVESAEVQFKDLRSKKVDTERKEVGSLAHQLRGCLLNFGFDEVGGKLLFIEKGDYAAADYMKLIDEAEAAFVASRKMLAARYPSLGIS